MSDARYIDARLEAHRRSEWLAYLKRLAEMEEFAALEQSCERAVHDRDVARAQLLDAHIARKRAELAWQTIQEARQTEFLDSLRKVLLAIIREVTDPMRAIAKIKAKLKESPCDAIDWTTFDEAFRSMYPMFRSSMIDVDAAVTAEELRIFALLKLRLSVRDIRTLLCISERRLADYRSRYDAMYRAE